MSPVKLLTVRGADGQVLINFVSSRIVCRRIFRGLVEKGRNTLRPFLVCFQK